jgi:transposase
MIYRREDVRQLGFSCAQDEVAAEPLVLTIDGFVESLDLSELSSRYSEAGMGYYDPGMLLKVWFFAYCDRSWHCRQVAERIRYDVRYRYFVGSHRPDFRTLNRFRKDHLDLLSGYFAALVSHCEELGLVDSSVLALDGTKLQANASGRKRSADALRQEINRRLTQDVQADDDPSEPAAATSVSTTASSSAGVSATDPEARLMKTGEGTIRLCYNAQAVVDNQQIIVAADVGTDADDKSSFAPLLEQAQDNIRSALGAITADGGYYSGRNIKYAQERKLDIYLPKGKANHKVYGLEAFVYDSANDRYCCPQGLWLQRGAQRQRRGLLMTIYQSSRKQCRDCPLKTNCTHDRYRRLEVPETWVPERALAVKLATPHGRALYARRRELVEPVFGHLKFNLGFTRFSLRGLAQVKGEFLLLCMAHNLKKLAQWRGYRQTATPLSAVLDLIRACLNCFLAIFGTTSAFRKKFALASSST